MNEVIVEKLAVDAMRSRASRYRASFSGSRPVDELEDSGASWAAAPVRVSKRKPQALL